MSLLTYNNVALPYPDITKFDQRALGDDVSNTDWYCTEFDIEVQCMVNTDYVGVLLPGQMVQGTQYNPADIMRVVRQRLLARRKTLSVMFNGTELIPLQAGVPGTVDARNGPTPQFCRIIELTNTTFFVHYGIKACYWENYDAGGSINLANVNQPGNPVVYNRWTEQVEMDGCQFSTRIRSGKYAIRSDNVQGFVADQLRSNMAIVSVPEGFLRKKSTYKVDPGGLAIEYTVIDEEQFKMPPAPAFEADGTYQEMSSRGSAQRIATATITLRGAKTTSQADLAIVAVRVVRDKLTRNQVRLPGVVGGAAKAIPLEIVTEVDMFRNVVRVTLKAMTGVGRGRVVNGLTSPSNEDLVFTPHSTSTYTPAYTDRGTAQFLLQAAAYYDPSLEGNVLQGGNQVSDANQFTSIQNNKVNMRFGQQPGQAGAREE